MTESPDTEAGSKEELDLEGLTRPLLQVLQRLTRLDTTYLTLIDRDRSSQTILFSHETGHIRLPEGLSVPWADTLCRRAIEARLTHVNDVPALWPEATAAQELGIRSFLSVPVRDSEGDVIGTLCGASDEADQMQDLEWLKPVLQQLAALISRQLEREVRFRDVSVQRHNLDRELSELRLMVEIGQLCWQASDLGAAQWRVAERLQGFGAWRQVLIAPAAPNEAQTLDLALAGRLLDCAGPVLDPESGALTALRDELPAALCARVDALVSFRVKTLSLISVGGNTELQGLLLLLSDSVVPQTDSMRLVAECSGRYLSILGSRLHHQRQLELANHELSELASRDPLTGLFNRRVLLHELRRVLTWADRVNLPICVVYIDMDGFKSINDRYGHDVGDRMLIEMGQRLQTASRATDIVARVGGDEFVVMMPLTGEHEVQQETLAQLRERLRNELAGDYSVSADQVVHYTGPSVGLAVGRDSSVDPEHLIARADADMYREKRLRRSRIPS